MNKPKPRKCRIKAEGCEITYTPFNSLQKCCYNAKCVMANHRKEEENKAAKKAYKERQESKQNKKALRDFNRKDLRWQHKHTQKAFNRMRVLEEFLWFAERGLEPECISCGKTLGNDQWCCGHMKTRGAQSGLRYDKRNTFLQHNRKCNMGLSGDIEGTASTRGYKRGLIDRFGEEEGQLIIDYCERNVAPIKWEWQELEAFRAECNERIRDLEKALD